MHPVARRLCRSGCGDQPQGQAPADAAEFCEPESWNDEPAQTVTLTNAGTTTLKLFELTIDCNFAFASGTTCSKGTALQPGSSCVMNVTFTPKARGAQRPHHPPGQRCDPAAETCDVEGMGD